MKRCDKTFRFYCHPVRELARCVGGKAVDATVHFGEIEVPALFWRTCVSRSLCCYNKDTVASYHALKVVLYPATGSNHLVDHDSPEVGHCNPSQQAAFLACTNVAWNRPALCYHGKSGLTWDTSVVRVSSESQFSSVCTAQTIPASRQKGHRCRSFGLLGHCRLRKNRCQQHPAMCEGRGTFSSHACAITPPPRS